MSTPETPKLPVTPPPVQTPVTVAQKQSVQASAPMPPPVPLSTVPADATKKEACLSQDKELDVLIRARYPIIYIESWEEERIENVLREIARFREKDFYVWTITEGVVKADEGARPVGRSNKTTDPLTALDTVLGHVRPAIYMFKDFHPFIEENRNNLAVIRRMRDVAEYFRDSYKTIVIVSPTTRIARELQKDVTVMQYALPTKDELGKLLDRIVDEVKNNPKIKINLTPEGRDRLLTAAGGLTLKEAENVFAKTLVQKGQLSGSDVSLVFSEKQQIIRKNGLLEYYQTQEKIDNVAGLANLKLWLSKRTAAQTEKAAKYGLPAPRGVLLLGVQGCGKSLCAKAISSMWEQPLLRFDLGRLFSGLVGSSEENVRSAISVAESVAPAILWVDEIDKAVAGAGGSGNNDGGTSARVFGTLLTWLAEKTAPVFVIATANNISNLPPELMRKGRFDEIFFVDLPTQPERIETLRIHLAKRGRDPKNFDLDTIARLGEGFSGAELEEVVVAALFEAFSAKQHLATQHMVRVISETVPLSRTMHEGLTRLREWAVGRARPASAVVEEHRSGDGIGREGNG
ncbi:MAG: AAA family ATPase [Planctomycetaceae bacterium]|nr:AAA family ATPase [Planctomycetaceae bacterium]